MGTYGRFQLVVSHGEGCHLWDTDGKRYLDFAAGISTSSCSCSASLVMAVACPSARLIVVVSFTKDVSKAEC